MTNVGGVKALNQQISDAERAYFNIPDFVRSYLAGNSPRLTEAGLQGNNRQLEEDSLTKAGSRGARIAQEARINALRHQRAALNPDQDGNIPYEAFDPKNLSNPNNVAGWPGMPNDPYAPPQGRVSGYRSENQGATAAAEIDAALKSEEEAAKQLDPFLRANYTGSAKNAGTFADTEQFKKGFEDDLQAGLTGAEAVSLDRINALRAARGMPPIESLDPLTSTNALGTPYQESNDGTIPGTITTSPITTQAPAPTTTSSYRGKTDTSALLEPSATAPTATATTYGTSQLVDSAPVQTEANATGSATTSQKETDTATTPENQLSSGSLQSGVKGLSNKSRLSALRMR
jgi:hypothetical protein